MIDWKDELSKLPPEDRLDYAIYLLEELAGGNSNQVGFLIQQYGLTRAEARMFATMINAYPNPASLERIHRALFGLNEKDYVKNSIAVFANKIRQKVGKSAAINVYSVGYRTEVVPEGYNELSTMAIVDMSRVNQRYMRRDTTDKVINARGVPVPRDFAAMNSPWTADDDQVLIQMKLNGSEPWAIAEELGRTTRSVLDRINVLKDKARELMSKG